MSKFQDLVKAGQSTAHSQIKWYLELERYRRSKEYEKEGFKLWTAVLDALLKKIRRSRSGVMAKLAQVRLLLDSKKVTFEQLEKIGDANATMLCRLYRVKGINDQWVKKAITWQVEKFKMAVLKAVKPSEEPKRHLTFVVVQSLYTEVMSLIGRIQTLVKLKTKEGALEFIVADYLTMEDQEILHQAGESSPVKERLHKVRQLELETTTKSKASKSKPSKDGSPSLTKKQKASVPMGSERMRSVSVISSSASLDGESDSSSPVPETTTANVS